jgi:hypothetical protein
LHQTPRVHHAARWRGGGVAACCACQQPTEERCKNFRSVRLCGTHGTRWWWSSTSLAGRRRFCAIAASVNSSCASRGPRNRRRPSLRMRLRWANNISTRLRSRRDCSNVAREWQRLRAHRPPVLRSRGTRCSRIVRCSASRVIDQSRFFKFLSSQGVSNFAQIPPGPCAYNTSSLKPLRLRTSNSSRQKPSATWRDTIESKATAWKWRPPFS